MISRKPRYVVIYEIRTKGTRALQEDNSMIWESTFEEFSLRSIKEAILTMHAYDENIHYVRVLGVTALIDEANMKKDLLQPLTSEIDLAIIDT